MSDREFAIDSRIIRSVAEESEKSGSDGKIDYSVSTGDFIVNIKYAQNHTWQGTVTWTKTHQTVSFRSALELIKLIDSAVDDDDSTVLNWDFSE